MYDDDDTIVAVATASGPASVGIVRLSGVAAKSIGGRLFTGELIDRQLNFGGFVDPAGESLDEGLAVWFAAPRSFTGEDVVELQGHGGPVVLEALVNAALVLGARLARPGEFTQRAFLNDKLDLAQAEAVADLIAAGSHAAARSALRSLRGTFSKSVNKIAEKILALRIYLEASLDFADEEGVDLLGEGEFTERLFGLDQELETLTKNARQGVLMSRGAQVALLGAPNVGKSSLLNVLAGRDEAIVTEIPGTTRDALQVDLVVGGVPIRLVDTAGVRSTEDRIEVEGVKRAISHAHAADLVLVVVAPNNGKYLPNEHSDEISGLISNDRSNVVRVCNKIDLISSIENPGPNPLKPCFEDVQTVYVSALTGSGLEELTDVIKEQLGFTPAADEVTARDRHVQALRSAHEHVRIARQKLVAARHSTADDQGSELVAEDLRAAHAALGGITGQVSADDLLGEIFSTFCIGK